ncbi:MAG: DUF4430 domain-containing protein [Candidatus Thorarchaeota archaeon]|nr:DUF4430 domain-containing protein [Candidatus Thorarchaeota archaeon]
MPPAKILTLIVIIMAFSTSTGNLSLRVGSQYILAGSNVTLTVDFGNGTITTFSNLAGPDVLAITESVLKVETEWAGGFAFVNSIEGISNSLEDGLWWQYWVNGDYGQIAANQYEIQDNDHVLWNRTRSAVNTDSYPENTTELLAFGMLLAALASGFIILVRYLMKKGE